ncbi:Apc4 multi-domain protein [Pyrenophora tritici-repentis]|nr:Apc4 multi-domain protein [Pyrenophora tritici-repentis]KAI1556350.1 Apc4 multi-domain protein [Pyrenophora tritici-repentis]KAI1579496.1 Apc4 multi-domain protein [Pyrenophora tritici-repentis]KAI1606514.1 Apc4 multi-domain protein [Pyrenophora tritici-repentis]PWO29467.1 Prp18 domain containing protein [Pyrenophora tritici-repentis]
MATASSPKERQLLQQAEKILLHPIHPHLISYCPTMDLVAVVTDEENLDVYRINGQRAFGLKRKSDDVSVVELQWEFSGKSIAVSWTDGSTDLVSAETGKITHKDLRLPEVEDETPTQVKCMGWGLNFINVETVKRRTGLKPKTNDGTTPAKTDIFGHPTTEDWDGLKDDTTLEDFLQRQPDFQTLDVAPDLPDQLAMMDMEALLPKLPAIPLPPALPFMRVSQADSGAFSLQAEVDSLLHSYHLKDNNSVDMFIRLSDRGTVHPSIYDSLETVSVQLPKAWSVLSTPLLHTSHPYSCTHGLLMDTRLSSSPTKKSIAYVPLTLNFIPSAGIYLHLIAAKTSQLQNLLLYITQTLQRIRAFFKHSQDLPRKFMMNIEETLEEKGLGDLVTNLFHIACTGHCNPVVKEWLVDELAEGGHKRWDTTVTTSFTTLLALLHENLIPALDRCSIVISRLRGLAQFHDRDWIFSGPISDFTALLQTLKKMRLLAHTAMLYASEEKRQFHSFSKWLRFTIDFEATEPESQSRTEMEQRDAGVDISQVLAYIQYGLTKSDVTPFLRPEAQLDPKTKARDEASYGDTNKAIELLKEGASFKEEALCLEHVAGHLSTGVTGLLKQVSKWQEANIQMDSGIVLEEGEKDDYEILDMRMVFDPLAPPLPASSPSPADDTPEDPISTYILLSPPSNPSTLHIHRITHAPNITHLAKDTLSYNVSTLDFASSSSEAAGQQTKILDAKFADDGMVLLLLQQSQPYNTTANQEQHRNTIISLPYTSTRSPTTTSPSLIFPDPRSHTPSTALPPKSLLPKGHPAPLSHRNTIIMTPPMLQKYTRHVFEARFTPLKLVVNGRKGRRVIVVLGSDCKHYRVLDMDYKY